MKTKKMRFERMVANLATRKRRARYGYSYVRRAEEVLKVRQRREAWELLAAAERNMRAVKRFMVEFSGPYSSKPKAEVPYLISKGVF